MRGVYDVVTEVGVFSVCSLPDGQVPAAGCSGQDVCPAFRRGRLQDVPESALQWESLWHTSGPLGLF